MVKKYPYPKEKNALLDISCQKMLCKEDSIDNNENVCDENQIFSSLDALPTNQRHEDVGKRGWVFYYFL